MVFFDPRHTTLDDLAAVHDEDAIGAAFRSSVNQLPPSIQAVASKIFHLIEPFFQTPSIPFEIESFTKGLSAHPEQIHEVDRYLSMMAQVGSDPEKILRELGAFLFFLSRDLIPDPSQPSLFKALTHYISSQLHAFQRGVHLAPLEVQRILPTGQRDWVVTLLASLMLQPDGRFSEVGAATAYALVKETSVGLEWSPEGRSQLIVLITGMITRTGLHELIEEPIFIDSRLEVLIKMDLGLPLSTRLSQRDVKIAILKAMLWEERQPVLEGNCYFYGSLSFTKWMEPEQCYLYLQRCLEKEGALLDLTKLRLPISEAANLMISHQRLASYSWMEGFAHFSGCQMDLPQQHISTLQEAFATLFNPEVAVDAAAYLGARIIPATLQLGMVYAEFIQINPWVLEGSEDLYFQSMTGRSPFLDSLTTPMIKGIVSAILPQKYKRKFKGAFEARRDHLIRFFLGSTCFCVSGDIPQADNGALESRRYLSLGKFDPHSRTYQPVMRVQDVVTLIDESMEALAVEQQRPLWIETLRQRFKGKGFVPQLIASLNQHLHGPDKLAIKEGILVFKHFEGRTSTVLSHCFGIPNTTQSTPYRSVLDLLEGMQAIHQQPMPALVITRPDCKEDSGHAFVVIDRDDKLCERATIQAIVNRYLMEPAQRYFNRPVPPELLRLLLGSLFANQLSRRAKRKYQGLTYGQLHKKLVNSSLHPSHVSETLNRYFYYIDGRGVVPSQIIRQLGIESSLPLQRQMDAIWQAHYGKWGSLSSIAKQIQRLAAQYFTQSIPFGSILDKVAQGADLPHFFSLGDSNYYDEQQTQEAPEHLLSGVGYHFYRQEMMPFELSAAGFNESSLLGPGVILHIKI